MITDLVVQQPRKFQWFLWSFVKLYVAFKLGVVERSLGHGHYISCGRQHAMGSMSYWSENSTLSGTYCIGRTHVTGGPETCYGEMLSQVHCLILCLCLADANVDGVIYNKTTLWIIDSSN